MLCKILHAFLHRQVLQVAEHLKLRVVSLSTDKTAVASETSSNAGQFTPLVVIVYFLRETLLHSLYNRNSGVRVGKQSVLPC
jgi:hypothetical protein